MSNAKLTRQGVRDLGSDARPRAVCQHFYWSELIVVGHRYVSPDYEYEPIYGRRCMHCGEPRR